MAIQQASIVKSGTAQPAATGDVVQGETFNATSGYQKNSAALAAADLTQNGTGTTSTKFQLDSGNTGPQVKNNAGDLQVRNAADNAMAALDASQVKISGTSMLDAAGAAKVQTGVCGAGLVPNSGAIDVNADGSTLEIASDVLRMKDGGTTAAKLADAVADAISTQGLSHDNEGDTNADTFRVTVQVKDAQGNALAGYFLIQWWLADAAYSVTLTAQAPTIVHQAGAALESLTANKHGRSRTDSAGKLQLDITLAGNLTLEFQAAVLGPVANLQCDYN